MLKIKNNSLIELSNFAKAFIPVLKNKPLICLEGDLGSGKTTFVKFLLEHLGYKGAVTSPTFNLISSYEVAGEYIYHCDFYRLNSSNELYNLAIEDVILENVVIVEWADILKEIIDIDYINIKFYCDAQTERQIVITTENQWNLKLLKQIYQES